MRTANATSTARCWWCGAAPRRSRDRETDRHTSRDRQTGRQAGRQTDRQTGRQTDRQTDDRNEIQQRLHPRGRDGSRDGSARVQAGRVRGQCGTVPRRGYHPLAPRGGAAAQADGGGACGRRRGRAAGAALGAGVRRQVARGRGDDAHGGVLAAVPPDAAGGPVRLALRSEARFCAGHHSGREHTRTAHRGSAHQAAHAHAGHDGDDTLHRAACQICVNSSHSRDLEAPQRGRGQDPGGRGGLRGSGHR